MLELTKQEMDYADTGRTGAKEVAKHNGALHTQGVGAGRREKKETLWRLASSDPQGVTGWVRRGCDEWAGFG